MRDCIQRLILVSAVTNVQTLLLLQLYLHNAGQRNTAWILLGHAGRMAIALGMHRKADDWGLNIIEKNVRRLTWLTYHTFEQNFSFALGRPAATSLLGVTADLPDESFIDTEAYPRDFFRQSLALTHIGHRVKRLTAHLSGHYSERTVLETLVPAVESLKHDLESWQEELPVHLQVNHQSGLTGHQRPVILLHIYACHLSSVLCRAYALHQLSEHIKTDSSQSSTSTSIHALSQASVGAALEVFRLLLLLHNAGILEGEVWLDVYYFFHASIVISLPYIHNSAIVQLDRQSTSAIVSRLILAVRETKLSPTYTVLGQVGITLLTLVGLYSGKLNTHLETGAMSEAQLARPHPTANLRIDQILGLCPPASSDDLFSDMFGFNTRTDSTGPSSLMMGSDFWAERYYSNMGEHVQGIQFADSHANTRD
jgi:hypothetical protein